MSYGEKCAFHAKIFCRRRPLHAHARGVRIAGDRAADAGRVQHRAAAGAACGHCRGGKGQVGGAVSLGVGQRQPAVRRQCEVPAGGGMCRSKQAETACTAPSFTATGAPRSASSSAVGFCRICPCPSWVSVRGTPNSSFAGKCKAPWLPPLGEATQNKNRTLADAV